MGAISQEQVDRFIEDIAFVKKAIQKNTSILQRIDFRRSLRGVLLMSAASIFLFSLLFHLLIRHFGSFAAVPTTLNAILFCAMALVIIFLGFLKNFDVLKSARSLDPSISLMRLVREYYTIQIYHHFIPLLLVFAFAAVYAAIEGGPQFVIPILALGAGLLYCSSGTLLRIEEFIWAGYWFILTGGIVAVFHSISPLLGICLTMGCGLFVLGVALYVPRKKTQEE